MGYDGLPSCPSCVSLFDTAMKEPSGVTIPKGYIAGGIHCGLKRDALDLAMVKSKVPCRVAGVFTTNQVKGAPVLYSQKVVEKGQAQAIVVNSRIANVLTGKQGLKDAKEMAKATGEALDVDPKHVIVGSTGVIGQLLPMDTVLDGIARLAPRLSREGAKRAAAGIMTTDTHPKEYHQTFKLGRSTVSIGAMAKGAGMIEPSMATMLCYLTTDAAISLQLMRSALKEAVDLSFNRISVDGDRSTSDSVVLLANGLAGNKSISQKGTHFRTFVKHLREICVHLAKEILRDGEGSTKLACIRVEKVRSQKDADKIARQIGNSLLLKTALFGNDANWGRVIASAGAAGVPFNPDKVSVYLDGLCLAKNGSPTDYKESEAEKRIRAPEVTFRLVLNQGTHSSEFWTCDISYEYVQINAAYRT